MGKPCLGDPADTAEMVQARKEKRKGRAETGEEAQAETDDQAAKKARLVTGARADAEDKAAKKERLVKRAQAETEGSQSASQKKQDEVSQASSGTVVLEKKMSYLERARLRRRASEASPSAPAPVPLSSGPISLSSAQARSPSIGGSPQCLPSPARSGTPFVDRSEETSSAYVPRTSAEDAVIPSLLGQDISRSQGADKQPDRQASLLDDIYSSFQQWASSVQDRLRALVKDKDEEVSRLRARLKESSRKLNAKDEEYSSKMKELEAGLTSLNSRLAESEAKRNAALSEQALSAVHLQLATQKLEAARTEFESHRKISQTALEAKESEVFSLQSQLSVEKTKNASLEQKVQKLSASRDLILEEYVVSEDASLEQHQVALECVRPFLRKLAGKFPSRFQGIMTAGTILVNKHFSRWFGPEFEGQDEVMDYDEFENFQPPDEPVVVNPPRAEDDSSLSPCI